MKLYAKVTGLKNGQYVEKGQGSNQSLSIEILADGLKGIPTRSNIYRLSLNIGNDNELQAELLDYSTSKTIELTKGEKQKGEVCPNCKQFTVFDDHNNNRWKSCKNCDWWRSK